MRSAMREWYPLDAQERDLLLSTGTVVFDASSLLALYRLSLEDRARVVDLLDAFKERLWLPRQAAEEYHRNRLQVVYEQLDAYNDIAKRVQALRNQVVESLRAHPVLTQEHIRREISDRLTALERYLQEQHDSMHPEDLRDPIHGDGVLDALTELFEGRVGAGLVIDDEILKVAEDRFTRKVPPGYEDAKKPKPECYGDYFVWREMLAHVGGNDANSEGTHGVIMVTEETKGDWWLKETTRQQLVGPRPELVREASEAGVSPFWLMSLRRFFTAAASHLGWERVELGEFSSAREEDTDRQLVRQTLSEEPNIEEGSASALTGNRPEPRHGGASDGANDVGGRPYSVDHGSPNEEDS